MSTEPLPTGSEPARTPYAVKVQVGQLLGRFKVTGVLGRGSMGTVLSAEDVALRRPVALKVRPHRTDEPKRRARSEQFIREARAAAQLVHPHIVQVFEVGIASGLVFIAMEVLECGTLEHRVQANGPMDVARACDCVQQAASALDFAHERGVLHRDIKPANLMLAASGHCKVADFGLAHVDSADAAGDSNTTAIGTPNYMAPEAAQGGGSARSDVFSLAATLWHLLTGRPPFRLTQLRDVLRIHHEIPLPDLRLIRPDVPTPVAEVIVRGLAYDATARQASAGEFASALALALQMPAEGRPTRARRRPQKRRSAAGRLLLVVALGLVGGFFALQWRGGRPTEPASPDVPGTVDTGERLPAAAAPAAIDSPLPVETGLRILSAEDDFGTLAQIARNPDGRPRTLIVTATDRPRRDGREIAFPLRGPGRGDAMHLVVRTERISDFKRSIDSSNLEALGVATLVVTGPIEWDAERGTPRLTYGPATPVCLVGPPDRVVASNETEVLIAGVLSGAEFTVHGSVASVEDRPNGTAIILAALPGSLRVEATITRNYAAAMSRKFGGKPELSLVGRTVSLTGLPTLDRPAGRVAFALRSTRDIDLAGNAGDGASGRSTDDVVDVSRDTSIKRMLRDGDEALHTFRGELRRTPLRRDDELHIQFKSGENVVVIAAGDAVTSLEGRYGRDAVKLYPNHIEVVGRMVREGRGAPANRINEGKAIRAVRP